MSEKIPNKDWNQFAQEDPFNGNFVEGFIARHSGDDYGALFIQKVNGKKASQLIYCTPKIHYPFGVDGKWHFPKAHEISRWTKWDGTNIFCFMYRDADGGEFVSYKTRLLPFVQESKFGPFQSMWREMLQKYPDIPKVVLRSGMNLSFELAGARNPHLVKYDFPLDAFFLFARNGQEILPPSKLPHEGLFPDAGFLGYVDRDYVYNYQQAQKDMEDVLRETDDGYIGQEGEVWYILTDGGWTPLKCKPSTIEAIHFTSGGIPTNSIYTTCVNAFENYDSPTIENVKQLLLEEFSAPEIEKVHYKIEKQLVKAYEQVEFKEKVLGEYNNLGINILDDKASVMRALSTRFPKGQMSRVFSTIWYNVVR